MKIKRTPLILIVIATVVVIAILFLPNPNMSISDIEQNPDAWLTEYTKPDDPAVIANLEHIITPDGVLSIKDVYDIQEWVGGNIRYISADPVYPSETLKRGEGNCWSQASLMYSLVLAEDPDADSYIALIDVTAEGSAYTHCSVITHFDDEVIISDTTIGPTISTYCILDDLNSATRRIVDGTNVDTYIIKKEISL